MVWFNLAQVGLALVVDHSGRCFTKASPSLKDLASNQEVPVLILLTSLCLVLPSGMYESHIGIGCFRP